MTQNKNNDHERRFPKNSRNHTTTKKSKKSQVLISRFFAASPGPPSSKPLAEETARPNTKESCQRSQLENVLITSSAVPPHSDLPLVAHDSAPTLLASALTTHTPALSSSSQPTTEKHVSTVSVLSPEPAALFQSTPPSNRRTRRVITDTDEESGCSPYSPPTKRLRSSKTPVAPTADVTDRTADRISYDSVRSPDPDFVEEQPDEDGDNSRDNEEFNNAPSNLASFSHQPGAPSIPRDEKRHKRFIHRIARLETDTFFLRYSGGVGRWDKEEPSVGKLSSNDGTPMKSKKNVKYTPLESQYISFSSKYPDMVLVVECGYKYRLFDKDASAASKVLRIASYVDHNFLTASFPTHRLAHHVARLVQAGYKVGVISQSETAALKKAGDNASKLFQRTLSAVYTKGTIVADGKLFPGEHLRRSTSYIMAVAEVSKQSCEAKEAKKNEVGIVLAAVDCTTGDVVYDGFLDNTLRSDFESRLVAIDPVEIIMPDSSLSKQTESVVRIFAENGNARIERANEALFDSPDDIPSMNEVVLKTMENLQGATSREVLKCLGALVRYLKTFKLDLSMTRVQGFKTFRTRGHMRIGADVLQNFEIFGNSNNGSTEGSLIGLVNRAQTPFGKRQLRRWVSQPLVNSTEIRARLETVEYLRDILAEVGHGTGEEGLYIAMHDLIASLSKVPDVERVLMRISCGKCTPAEVVGLIEAMEDVGRRTDHMKSLNPTNRFPNLLKNTISKCPIVSEVLEDAVIKALNRKAATGDDLEHLFERGDTAVSDLFDGVNEASSFVHCVMEVNERQSELKEEEDSMKKLLDKLKKKYSYPAWAWKKVGQDEYLLEVEKAKAASIPKSWTIVCQTKAVKRFRPDVAEEGYQRVLCAREKLDVVSKQCWTAYVELLAGVVNRFRGVVRMLAEIDCLTSLARVSLLAGYCKPTVLDQVDMLENEQCGLKAIKARHALTEHLSSCVSYVPNDVLVGIGSAVRGIVISGPNYGGKSSYVRMTALLVILAQIGSYVPAESLEIRPFDAIFARMGASDSIAKGMSSLMLELAETSRILSEASSRSLVILDELGRGTSTHDGAAIAHATMSHLVQNIKCVTMFVTHYPMLANLRSRFPELVDACYLDYREEEDNDDNRRKKITLLYKVTRGVAPNSYGLNVARLAGIPSLVLNDAYNEACNMETIMERKRCDSHWAALLSQRHWKDGESVRELLQKQK